MIVYACFIVVNYVVFNADSIIFPAYGENG